MNACPTIDHLPDQPGPDGNLPAPRQSALLEIPFANIRLDAALQAVLQACQRPASSSLFFVNAHCLNTTFEDDAYRRALGDAELIFPDGSGIRRGCSLQGDTLVENLNGTDLFPHLCALFARQQIPIFLLGAAPGTVERVAAWARSQYPDLRIAGTQHGYFSPEQTGEVITRINQSGARVLFVAMGVPRQELWIARHRQQLGTSLNIAVGGLFDFFAQNIPRAPRWMRRAGIEWVWRLLQEPGRMWRRYLVGNPLFLLRLWHERRAQAFLRQCPEQISSASQRLRLGIRAALQQLSWRWSQRRFQLGKRLLDISAAAAALVLLAPLYALIALVIRLDSPGPVFFRQVRAGYRGRPFVLWKFRSMYQDAEARRAELEAHNEMSGGVLFKMKNDPRVTRVGRLLRKLSLDELPQLWNVLRGDMSLVGPRPALHSEIAHYEVEQRQRLDILPGLTSDWVIAGRSRVPFSRQAELDIDYAHRPSLGRDLKLILKTIPALISGRGAC